MPRRIPGAFPPCPQLVSGHACNGSVCFGGVVGDGMSLVIFLRALAPIARCHILPSPHTEPLPSSVQCNAHRRGVCCADRVLYVGFSTLCCTQYYIVLQYLSLPLEKVLYLVIGSLSCDCFGVAVAGHAHQPRTSGEAIPDVARAVHPRPAPSRLPRPAALQAAPRPSPRPLTPSPLPLEPNKYNILRWFRTLRPWLDEGVAGDWGGCSPT